MDLFQIRIVWPCIERLLPISKIEIVTNWKKIHHDIEVASKSFPQSSLALQTHEYYSAISSLPVINNSFIVTVSGIVAAAVISIGNSAGFDFFGQPAIVEFSSKPEIQEQIGHIRRLVARQILEGTASESTNSISYFVPPTQSLDEFGRGLLDEGWLPEVRYEGVINLNKDIAQIEKSLRKNYLRDIRKAEKALGLPQIHGQNTSDKTFNEFRNLHLVTAGRVTRSIDSWHEMLAALRRGRASLVTISHAGELVGGTFCWISEGAALYGSGAYKRELFSQFPISHLTLFHSITYANTLGCRKFFVGQTYTPQGTNKEQAIAFFKRGFSEIIQTKLVLRT